MNIRINIIENILLMSVRMGLTLILLTPLIFGPFGLSFAEYPEAVFFRSLIEIIFVLYISLLLVNKKYLPKVSPFLISILVFDGVMIVSSVFGLNFYHSFFGDIFRGEGIIMHIHLLVFLVVLIGILKNREDWINMFKIAVFISGISSIAAVLQAFNVIQLFNMAPPRASGTMVNPDIFGYYVALSIFIAFFIYLVEQKKTHKPFWLFFVILNCYALFLSGTRGSILGATLGVLSIVSYILLKSNRKIRIIILISILFFLSLFLALSLNRTILEKIPGGYAISHLQEFDLGGREKIWAILPPAIMAHPILGWGSESFTFISDKYMTSGFIGNPSVDRAHNKVIDVLICNGIVGLMSYLAIFAVITYLILKNENLWSERNNQLKLPGGIILSAFFICYFSQNLFLFDSTASYILFFLIAGFLNNSFPRKIESAVGSNTKPHNAKWIFFSKISFILFLSLLMVETIYTVNIKPTIAATYLIAPVSKDEAKQVFSGYKKAIKMDTLYDSDLKMSFVIKSLGLLENNYAGGFQQEVLDELIKTKPVLRNNIKNSGERINASYKWLAMIDEREYMNGGDKNSLESMSNVINEAISFNPNISVFYQLRGESEIMHNNYNEGECDIKKSCSMDGCLNQELYIKFGSAYGKNNDTKEEIKNYQKALDIYFNDYKNNKTQHIISPANLVGLINYVGTSYCKKLNDLKSCKKVFEEGIRLLPDYADTFVFRLNQLEANK